MIDPADDELARVHHHARLMEQMVKQVQTERDREKARADALVGQIASLTAEREKFKAYVHRRLDEAGVPVDPPSPHREQGCRIGGRLDWVFAQLAEVRGAGRRADDHRGHPSHQPSPWAPRRLAG